MSGARSIDVHSVAWYPVRLSRAANANRRTTVIGAEPEGYRNRKGQTCVRPRRGTGQRVFVPELILQRAGFEVFLPKRKVARRVSRYRDDTKLFDVPAMFDWLFVGMPFGAARFAELMALDVVRSVAGADGYPVRVGPRVMQLVVRKYGGRVRNALAERALCAGDRVVLWEEPLCDREAVVLDPLDGQCTRVLVSLLGRDVAMDVRTGMVEFVDRGA